MDGKTQFEAEGIKFSVIPVDRSEEVVEFIFKHFLPDEPICRSLGLKDRHPILDALFMDPIKSGSCVMATNAENRIIGVRISEIVERNNWSQYLADKFVKGVLPKFGWLMRKDVSALLKALTTLMKAVEYDNWTKFKEISDCNKILGAFCLCTDQSIRSRGLGTELVRQNERIGKELGCQLTTVFVTGIYSSRVFQKLNYTTLKDFPYAEYKGSDGTPVLKDTREHTYCRSAIKYLRDQSDQES